MITPQVKRDGSSRPLGSQVPANSTDSITADEDADGTANQRSATAYVFCASVPLRRPISAFAAYNWSTEAGTSTCPAGIVTTGVHEFGWRARAGRRDPERCLSAWNAGAGADRDVVAGALAGMAGIQQVLGTDLPLTDGVAASVWPGCMQGSCGWTSASPIQISDRSPSSLDLRLTTNVNEPVSLQFRRVVHRNQARLSTGELQRPPIGRLGAQNCWTMNDIQSGERTAQDDSRTLGRLTYRPGSRL